MPSPHTPAPRATESPTAVAATASPTPEGAPRRLDPDGDPLAYAWTQVSGEEVTLSGGDTASPTFTAPAEAGILEFSLLVSDRSADSAPATVIITVAVEGEETPTGPPVDYDADGDNLIEVSTLAQFKAIRWDLDGNGSSRDRGYARAFPNPEEGMGCASTCVGYELTGDVDLGSENWDPIGYQGSRDLDRSGDVPFTATFDGNGYVIRNLFIDRPNTSGVGLFGVTGPGSEIRNVGISQANVTGFNNVGVLVGQSNGSIRYSWATGTATGRGTNVGGITGHQRRGSGEMLAANWARVEVTGRSNLGGLVGILQQAEVVASYATGRVTCVDDCTGSRGGLVGSLRNGGSVTASYATGAVLPATGGDRVGGLVGELRDGAGSVTASYWDTERSGVTSDRAGQGEGKTTSELRAPTGYTGIYASWNVDLDGDGSGDNPWDFGSNGSDTALRPTGGD